jgi:hypothetical protein
MYVKSLELLVRFWKVHVKMRPQKILLEDLLLWYVKDSCSDGMLYPSLSEW